MKLLPPGSFHLSFDFELCTPYSSKGDDSGQGNSIVVEWIFRLPMVLPTTWKGNLRFAMRQAGPSELVRRLFGSERLDVEPCEGQLHFYPTFFTCADLSTQVLIPHDRKTRFRQGRNMVTTEVVGEVGRRVSGRLALVYLSAVGETSEASRMAGLAVSRGVASMLTFHGFGAKKLKGWGLARPELRNIRLLQASRDVTRPCDDVNRLVNLFGDTA